MVRPLRPFPVLVLSVIWLLAACGGSGGAATGAATLARPTVAAAVSVPSSSDATSTRATAAAATSQVAATSQPAAVTTSAKAPAPPAAASSAAAPAPTPNPVLPVKLAIPAIGVDAPVEEVGLTPDGAMDVPKQWSDVAWYEYGPVPGQPGNAAVAGHLDSTTAPAVFWRLGTLKPGDKVIVSLSNSQTITFEVTEKDTYPYNAAPIDRIFGPATTANLNLITCGGAWDAQAKNYSNRVVIYTQKVNG